MTVSDTVIIVGAISGLLTAATLFGGFILSVLNFMRQGKRDSILHELKMSVDGLSDEAKASAKGQASAEAKTAHLEEMTEGIAAERADPMSPVGK